eukprot:6422466-Prymnesium_polylepis.1
MASRGEGPRLGTRTSHARDSTSQEPEPERRGEDYVRLFRIIFNTTHGSHDDANKCNGFACWSTPPNKKTHRARPGSPKCKERALPPCADRIRAPLPAVCTAPTVGPIATRNSVSHPDGRCRIRRPPTQPAAR